MICLIIVNSIAIDEDKGQNKFYFITPTIIVEFIILILLLDYGISSSWETKCKGKKKRQHKI